MSLNFSFNDDFDEPFAEENESEFSIRENIIFLVDGAQEMYENDSPFRQCLETYKNIVRQKCSRNKRDKMGLVIFGTKEKNCDVENVTVLQQFDTVTIDTLKNIQRILKEGDKKYKESASDSKYSLYDVLVYACQLLQTSGTTAKKTSNIILLCTCNDNPCSDDSVERRRIQHLIATFKDTRTELRVVGLSESWNDDYYKDLQIISGTFGNDDYRRIELKDFERTVVNPARSICKLPWKISSKISIEVALYNLISSPTYPSKIKLEKEGNEILEACHVLQEKNIENLEDTESLNLGVNGVKEEKPILTSDLIMYFKTYSGTNVYFKQSECKKLKNLGFEPSIEILAFKPAMCDPLYHVDSPYFVTYTPTCNNESKSFFMSFVSKCYEKKVMSICKVVTKFSILICTMIPSKSDGGFYMYKIPFNDKVRELENLAHYKFSPEKQCSINQKAADVFKELMDHSKIKFDVRKFRNPKLEKCIAHIEALALDEKLSTLPPDSTLPPPINDDVQSLKDELVSLLNLRTAESSSKRSNSQASDASKKTKFDIPLMAANRALQGLTVADLKDYLKSVNLSTAGNKSNLIERIYHSLML